MTKPYYNVNQVEINAKHSLKDFLLISYQH